jgi:hypothetical protein
MRPRPVFTIPSVAAAFCAIGSFASHAAWGFILAILAIVLGALGILLSFIPGRRGALVSVVSIIAGLFGIIAAVVKLLI